MSRWICSYSGSASSPSTSSTSARACCGVLRVLHQEIDREGQQPAGGLVTGDQEGEALGDDVVVGQRLPALLVDAGEHQPQQVGVVRLVAEPAPVGHQSLDQIDLKLLVLLGLSPGLDPQLALDRQLLGLLLPFGEVAHHGRDERVRGVPVQRVEAVVETAERDGVQGQRGHVLRNVDLVIGIEPGPLVHQLPGDVDHPRQIAAHGLLAERRHQDVVGAAPHRIGRLAGEQTPGWSGRPARPSARRRAACRTGCRRRSPRPGPRPETMTRSLPGTCSRKIGPYSRPHSMSLSIGLGVFRSSRFPRNGTPCGPGS